MARLTNGINGSFRGKVGSVIGSSNNGVDYIKGPHKKRTTNVSGKELDNREKFSVAQAWLKPLLHFVREGYKSYGQKSYGFVAAKSHLLKHAMNRDENGFNILPKLMMVSSGTLPLSENIQVQQLNDRELQFTWDTTCPKDADPDDQAMLLAYSPADNLVFGTTTGQFRKTGKDIIEFYGKAGMRYHIYVAFNAADRSTQSDSVYLGELVTE
jgi:hypothetical protein